MPVVLTSSLMHFTIERPEGERNQRTPPTCSMLQRMHVEPLYELGYHVTFPSFLIFSSLFGWSVSQEGRGK